ncbi:MAG: ComEC/Rec2 family competence protein [Chloroflexota bacterium]
MAAALLALAWLLGAAAASMSGVDWWVIVGAASLFAAGTFAWRTRPRGLRADGMPRKRRSQVTTVVVMALGVATVLIAGWRYDVAGAPDLSLARLNDGPAVKLRGVVSDEPEERETTTLYRLDISDVFEGGEWRAQPGAVLVRGPIAPRYEYGDALEIEAKLETPPTFADFDYRDYLATRGIASIVSFPKTTVIAHDQGNWLRATMIDVKSHLSRALSDVLPEPHSSLAAGILYGERSAIPDDLSSDMRITGTSHLVAVSGQNVTIVAAMVIAVLAWLIGRRPAAWVSLGAIVGYTMLVGVQPSVIRAAIMGGIFVIATISGRQRSSLTALLLAGAVMSALDAKVIDDVSFQLSFAATVGLTTLSGPLRVRLQNAANRSAIIGGFPLTAPAIEGFAVTVAAVLFTLPITALKFGQISIVAPIANMFVVPAFLAVGLTAGVAAAIDLIAPGLAPIGSWIAWPAAEYMIEAIRLFASVPGASATLDGVQTWEAGVWYGVLLAGTWWVASHPGEAIEPSPPPEPVARRALLPASGLALLVALAGVTALLYLSRPEGGRLSVTFLDVGQGDAILIEGPQGNRVLVDGGPGSLPITRALSRNLPFDDRRIDMVVLTHAQSDHMAGLLTVVDKYDVGEVLDAALPGTNGLYDAWEATVRDSGAAIVTADRGQGIDLGDGAMLRVLAPDDSDPLLTAVKDLNTSSTVLRLTIGDTSYLLTGDLDEAGERTLIASGTDLQANVLKVGHHGSKTSSSPEFLARVQPAIDVIEVGAANSFGHPAQETLGRLAGDLVLRTDEDGDVTVTTDGSRIWVER